MIRLLHTADLHLDTPFTGSGLNREQVLQRRADLVANFRDILSLVREKQVDLVCLAGDLFEEGYIAPATVNRLFSSMAELEPLPVLISPGNHDPFHSSSPYATENLPSNLYLFREDHIERIEFPEIGIAVYGLAFRSSREARPLLKDFKIQQDTDASVNILLCHGAVSGGESDQAEDYLPIDPADLRESGADYCALGHYHRHIKVWEDDRGVRTAYPGSPEPLRFGKTGDHGILIVGIEPDSGPISVERIVTQRRRYHHVQLDISDCADVSEIDRKVISSLGDEKLSGDIVELVVRGNLPPGIALNPVDYSGHHERIFALRFDDQTRPDYDLEAIAAEQSARGKFCRRMMQRLNNSSHGEEEHILYQALWLGLSAFDGYSIEDWKL